MRKTNPFTRHPASVGESYLEHLLNAGGFGLRLLGAGLAVLMHALLPFLFEHTGSRTVRNLDERLQGRVRRAGHGQRVPY